jgi:hypothetical protein
MDIKKAASLLSFTILLSIPQSLTNELAASADTGEGECESIPLLGSSGDIDLPYEYIQWAFDQDELSQEQAAQLESALDNFLFRNNHYEDPVEDICITPWSCQDGPPGSSISKLIRVTYPGGCHKCWGAGCITCCFWFTQSTKDPRCLCD